MFFAEKKVAFGQTLYEKYYNRLWPCEQTFISFLRTENSQQQLDCAISIVEQLSFQANFPLPGFVFRNLISSEHKGKDPNFIAQDHAIHSVNLYILGLYLFFNHKLFYTRLVKYFESVRILKPEFGSPIEQSAKAFFSAWRIFALYHDIGYVLERAADQQGFFNKTLDLTEQDLTVYKNLCDELLYETLTRALSRALYADILFQHSQYPMSNIMFLSCWSSESNWSCVTATEPSHEVKGTEIREKISQFESFVQLYNVNAWSELKHLIPFIDRDDLVTLVRDKNMNIVAISYREEERNHVFIRKNCNISNDILPCIDSIERLGSDEFPASGYTCEYYISKHNALEHVFRDGKYATSLPFISDQCNKKFGAEFSVSDRAQQEELRFKIYCWLQRQVPLQAISFSNQGHHVDYDIDVLKKCVKEFLLEKISQYDNRKKGNLESGIGHLIEQLQKNLQDATQSLMDNYNRAQNFDTERSSAPILNDILAGDFNICKRVLDFPTLLTFNKRDQRRGEKIVFCTNVLSKKGEPTIPSDIYKGISALANALTLDIKTLFGYRPESHSKYDHGIVSAVFVIRAYSAFQKLCQKVDTCPLLRCAWPVWKNDFEICVTKKDTNVFVQSVFAILLHDIYGKKYNKKYGIDYLQDITVNPFSYFCALCDSLQFWNRPKLINQGETKLPDDFATGRNFDLWISGGKIYLDCNSAKMRERVKAFDDYLLAASFMIDVYTQPAALLESNS